MAAEEGVRSRLSSTEDAFVIGAELKQRSP